MSLICLHVTRDVFVLLRPTRLKGPSCFEAAGSRVFINAILDYACAVWENLINGNWFKDMKECIQLQHPSIRFLFLIRATVGAGVSAWGERLAIHLSIHTTLTPCDTSTVFKQPNVFEGGEEKPREMQGRHDTHRQAENLSFTQLRLLLLHLVAPAPSGCPSKKYKID